MSTQLIIIGNDTSSLYLLRRFAEVCGLSAIFPKQDDLPTSSVADHDSLIIILDADHADWEILHQLRQRHTAPNTPLILCSWLEATAHTLPEGITESVSYFLQKPILLKDFKAALVSLGALDAQESTDHA